MASDTRGSTVRQGNFLRIDNALVEEVTFSGRNTGHILISYSAPQPNGTTTIELLRLNVNRNTAVLNPARLPMCFCDIRQGMWIDVTFSPAMTRSIPPQSNALVIVVKRPPVPSANVTTGRIAKIDADNNTLYTGSPFNINSQTKFIVTKSTVILNRFGFPVNLRALRPGQQVRITHANFQTASIPPQTTAYLIQVI